MAKCTTEPLEIICRLKDGCVATADGIIMFDAILYHAWFLKYEPEVLTGEKDERDIRHDMGLPLRHIDCDGGFFYSASKGIFEETGEELQFINKRPDFFGSGKIDYLNAEKGIISDSVGEFRAHRVPLLIHTVKDGIIKFYAYGTKAKTEDLLSRIGAVGKKTAAGYGAVKDWEVRSTDTDYSIFGGSGQLMRPVPVNWSEEILPYPQYNYAVRPPYHNVKNYRMCYVPA